jgi:alkanesulfonate monooxygenase SsuD/methylene tetrahydromethanopterin reductase-like flavin-dependent oxidoreductase (luciferase family)
VPYEERLRDEYSLVGTPDKVAQGVQAYVDIGADQLICLVQAGRVPHADIMASLRLFGTEVLPRFTASATDRAGAAASSAAAP